jgi:hypothetical protein
MWREYKIKASSGQIADILAPDLMCAFAQARGMWPSATHWECLGSKIH